MEEQNSPDQILKSWSRSKNSVICLEHIWILEKCSLLPQKTGESLLSPIISDQSEKVEWKLELYPKGQNEENKNFISLFLKLHNPQPAFKLSATIKLMLLNNKPTVIAQGRVFTKEFYQASCWGHAKLFDLNKITPTTLPGDELQVKCQVTYTVKQTSFYGSYPTLPLLVSSGSGTMASHYKQLFISKSLSDIVILVKASRFEAHKTVLCARSPVFLAMFQSNLTETQTNTVKINGIKPAVFREVLRFIYTDEVEKLNELAEELMAAAERYMLDLLKEKCATHLATKITVESCAHLLLLADLHSATGLKTIALDFFRSCTGEVIQTQSWQQLMDSAKPQLLRDINKALIMKTSGASQQSASMQ